MASTAHCGPAKHSVSLRHESHRQLALAGAFANSPPAGVDLDHSESAVHGRPTHCLHSACPLDRNHLQYPTESQASESSGVWYEPRHNSATATPFSRVALDRPATYSESSSHRV